ncbi:non-hydrolyzing UDP-N-acetylglucosamine 2-epimerase [Clostridium estertheticum]|uniref:non-hydrolyzing UDP-N-acetylglucosamine 2-epimerase n=1 Tax=Clostridium estertheticum TaxID=238834 RepID=UPI00209AF677|nr:UDP-N-acetylglucosamine 2-epimerase (non-hydrolyzing) [Clostridium estertheticum]
MKVFLIVGVRPHFIKSSLLIKELEKYFEVILIHTGQHYDYNMSEAFFKELNIRKPDYAIKVVNKNSNEKLFMMSLEISKIINKENPDCIIVIGDSNTPLAGALAGKLSHIPIAHIEAGVRNYNVNMEEEINRTIIDKIATIFFTPTEECVVNLKKESINNDVYFVGDLLLEVINRNIEKLELMPDVLKKLDLRSKEYVLLTIHRKENTNNIKNVLSIINNLDKTKGKIVFPVHPRVKKLMMESCEYKNLLKINSLKIIDPVNHENMISLLKNAKYVITDSNGIQRESYFVKTPCIIARDSTEVKETLENRCSILTENRLEILHQAIDYYESMPSIEYNTKKFGDGDSSVKIAKILHEYLSNSRI